MSPCVNERIAAAVARALPQLEALRDEVMRNAQQTRDYFEDRPQ